MPEIVDAFDRVARSASNDIAVMGDDATLTFDSLRSESMALADRMASAGVRAGDVVALALGRKAHHVTSMLAAWRLDAAFLPLDPAAPPTRQRACITESRARITVRPDLSFDATENAGDPLGAPTDELAYVVYTSGSTGRPKGVRVSHRGLVPVLSAQIEAFGLAPGKRALLYLSTAFDASLSDIGTSLLSGATLVIPEALPPPHQLAYVLRAARITHADLPPSILASIDPATLPDSLETVVIGGEVCPPHVVRAWARVTRVVNVYGPTEATICTSLGACDGETWERPRIGAPLPHVLYRVEEGELLIGGPAVALGYIDRPELEASRFVMRDGNRYYRTGDLVLGDDVRDLDFIGRLDRQLKVRGMLVSPEEIEAALAQLDGVAEVAVVTELAPSSRSVLTAYVVARAPSVTAASLEAALAEVLPSWMIPRVVVVASLARTASGKVDQAAVLQRSGDRRIRVVTNAFSEALGVGMLADDADFVALGGDSLAAFEVSWLAELAGVHVDASTILAERTPVAIAAADVEARLTVAEHDRAADRAWLRPREQPSRSGSDLDAPWLVTGAGGFLGSHLVPLLLERTTSTIHCVLREGATAAKNRLRSLSPRIVVHLGDVALPRMGLSPDAWRRLEEEVGHVVHAAAAVNLALPYAALAQPNIDGTLHAIELALAGRPKTLTHISTLAVLAASDAALTTIDEHAALPSTAHLFGAYAQTKYVAESIVRRAVPDALILRPGLLTGHSVTGASAPSCPLIAFLRAVAALGAIPAGDHARFRVDVTPIDYAASVIADLLLAHRRGVVHVASRSGASLTQLVHALRGRTAIETVDAGAFITRARIGLRRDHALALASASHRLLGRDGQREADLFLLTDRAFDCTRAAALSGRTCPTATPELLARYVDVALGESS